MSDKWSAVERLPPRVAEWLAPLLTKRTSGPDAGVGTAETGRMAIGAFATRVASAALAYGSQVLLARWMGGFDYGIFVVVWTLVITFGVIFCFGLEQAIVRLVREYLVAGDPGSIRGLLHASRATTFVGATLAAAAGVAILWEIGRAHV